MSGLLYTRHHDSDVVTSRSCYMIKGLMWMRRIGSRCISHRFRGQVGIIKLLLERDANAHVQDSASLTGSWHEKVRGGILFNFCWSMGPRYIVE
jgi:hypothetical protein